MVAAAALIATSLVLVFGSEGVASAQETAYPPCTKEANTAGAAALARGSWYTCRDAGDYTSQIADTHVCPNGFVMVGYSPGNIFLCTYVEADTAHYYVSKGLVRAE